MNQESINSKQQFAAFGRTFVLVFNRSFMYSPNHPFQVEAINSVFQAMKHLLNIISPAVFILNREQFYVDEEPLDPRLSVSRMVSHFKKTGMESISFYKGVNKKELQLFLEIVTSLDRYPDAEAMTKAMFKKRIEHIKINHIFYKKVSAEDEIISREILDNVTPEMEGEYQDKVKQMFMDSVFSSVLQEEFVKNLNLDNLLDNPGYFSSEMIAADLSTVENHENIHGNGNGKGNGNKKPGIKKDSTDSNGKNEAPRPGQFLLHQLEVIEQDVEKNLSQGTGTDLQQIAEALFDMREKLAEGIEAQKAMGIAYANEEEVLSKAAEITDNVLIRLIKEEYKGGEISVNRLAQILCRLIPEADRLKRLLPKIRSALFEEGMSQADFMNLVKEMGNELQSDSIAGMLAESAKEIGIKGEDILQKVRENPLQSAEMIYLASEIQEKSGDEKALTNLLVNYVEQIGSKYSKDIPTEKGKNGQNYIKQALSEVKSNLSQHLGNLDIKDDLLNRLEEKINRRMDEVFDKLKIEWINAHSNTSQHEVHRELTVLETFERGANEEEELWQILKIIRKKVESEEIDENDFDQIYSEINRLEQIRKSENNKKEFSNKIVREQALITYLDREIARADRYKIPLSVLGFTLVKIKSKQNSQQNKIKTGHVTAALLNQLVDIFRTPDIIGEVGKNNLIVLLPMTDEGQANLALRRVMKILNLTPLEIDGATYEIKVAGVVADTIINDSVDAASLMDRLSIQLKDMAVRISNLHANS